MTQFDAIVVGLGPTGATLAALLGQRGLKIAAFDRLPDLYPLPRAIGLDHEALRIMQELQIVDAILPRTAPYRPSEYRGMDGQLIKRLDSAPAPYRLGWAPNHVFDQPAFERAIRSRVAQLENVKVHLEAEVVTEGQGPDGVWADIRLRGEEALTRFQAKYLIACDGGSSPVRKRLGIGLEDLGFDEPWLVVDAIMSEAKLAELPQTQVQYCEAGRPSTFVVGPGNHRRWEIMLLPGDSLSPEFPDSELWPLLERWIKPGDGRLWRAAAYRFHGLVARQWRCGRFLLAGDSCHMTPPFMAQGMVQGLRDAQNLAWKLARVVEGTSSDSLLDSYEDERKPHVVATTVAAIELGRVICQRDPQLARERDARLLDGTDGVVPTTIRQNMIPDLDRGLIASQSPGAGSLFPQPKVRSATFEGWLDDLAGPRVWCVVLGALAASEAAAIVAELDKVEGVLIHLGEGELPAPTLQVQETAPVLAPWLSSLGQRVAIGRPDHYVYGTAVDPPAGLVLLREFLTRLAINNA